MIHGTRSCYQLTHCRCTPCRSAEANYRRVLRGQHARGQQPPGTLVSAMEPWYYLKLLRPEWLGDEIKARKFDGITPVPPIRGAVSSGHGAGKGALTGMLTNFIMSTRRESVHRQAQMALDTQWPVAKAITRKAG